MIRASGCLACTVAGLLVWAADGSATVRPTGVAAPVVAARASGARLLDVPYLPQSEDLCGGAAVAMVLRYWGEREIYPEDFAALVDRSASGIRTDVLAADLSRRGWRAFPLAVDLRSNSQWIREQIDLGRPIVALIEIRPNRYHYVVVVAWTDGQVVVHDPARAPFRVMSEADFDRAWAAAGRWALLLLPAEDSRPADTSLGAPDVETPSAANPCAALTQEMVELARAGDVAGAETGLLVATRLCPGNAPAWQGLAGVRFLQSRWAEASDLAERGVSLDPSDRPGWDLLATSRFLNDEPDGALDAWNRMGRPSVDVVRVEGARRTRYPVVAALVDLPARTLLTASRKGRAARRLEELPSAALTSLRYRPIDGGLAEIDAIVVERSTLPRGVAPVAAVATRAWIQREISLDVAAPSGSGELWTVAWRWWESRPRVAFALAFPAAFRLPGVTTIEASWERPSYATDGAGPTDAEVIQRDARRRAAVSLADWVTDRIRWDAGVALDRWAQSGHLSGDVSLDVRLLRDKLSVGFDMATWAPLRAGRRFARGGVSSVWRSTRDRGPSWSVVTGVLTTTAAAPLDLWPGAGTGQARTPLLRAHPLLDEGVVTGPVFGRQLAHGTVEYQHPLLTAQTGALRLVAFTDTARAWHRVGEDTTLSWHADVGAGVRIVLPGNGGTARVDVARGLRDRRVVLSAGWQAPWPGR